MGYVCVVVYCFFDNVFKRLFIRICFILCMCKGVFIGLVEVNCFVVVVVWFLEKIVEF